jgi:hypothetical protein
LVGFGSQGVSKMMQQWLDGARSPPKYVFILF